MPDNNNNDVNEAEQLEAIRYKHRKAWEEVLATLPEADRVWLRNQFTRLLHNSIQDKRGRDLQMLMSSMEVSIMDVNIAKRR